MLFNVTNGVLKGYPRVLNTNITPVSNTTSGSVNLMSYVIPANTLTQDGDALKFDIRGNVTSEPLSTFQLGFSFGGVDILLQDMQDVTGIPNGIEYAGVIKIFRTGANLGVCFYGSVDSIGNVPGTVVQVNAIEAGGSSLVTFLVNITPDWSVANTFQCYGILTGSSTAGVINQRLLRVTLEPTNT